ncbi:MAG TPA: hypothetical protein VFW43_09085 [Polaromonas sp.]|nr:hypothetical protein [Polaromonas sp.]
MVEIQTAASAGWPDPIVSLKVSADAVPMLAIAKKNAATVFNTVRFILSPQFLEVFSIDK